MGLFSFLNHDLFTEGAGKRRPLRLRDYILLTITAIVTWFLAAAGAWLAGKPWILSNFIAPIVVFAFIFFAVGLWMYPQIADTPPRRTLRNAAQWTVAGAIVFGFELHNGSRNAYEVLLKGLPRAGNWHTEGYPVAELLFVGAYNFVITAIRAKLWKRLDSRRDGSSVSTRQSELNDSEN